jgi:hypothetical protein
MHKFFHQVANLSRSNNSVEPMLVDDLVTSDQSVIREHIVHF